MADIVEAGNARRLQDLREAIARDDGPEYAKFLLAELDKALTTLQRAQGMFRDLDCCLDSLGVYRENLRDELE